MPIGWLIHAPGGRARRIGQLLSEQPAFKTLFEVPVATHVCGQT